MSNKQSTITLEYLKGGWMTKDQEYRVIKVTDSVMYNPGSYLTKPEVQGLCVNGAWKVTIISGGK